MEAIHILYWCSVAEISFCENPGILDSSTEFLHKRKDISLPPARGPNSMLYAGTPALKGDFTRTGQRTKLGLLQDGTNSAIRYVVNNFQDHRCGLSNMKELGL